MGNNDVQKAKEGDLVIFEGNYYRVKSVSWLTHSELIGSKAKPGFWYQLEPIAEDVEEVSGWVNGNRIKKARR
jgi:hypothetical protein